MQTLEQLKNEVDGLDHALESARHGIHNSQEWDEDHTRDYTGTGETYDEVIERRFAAIRNLLEKLEKNSQ